MFEKILIANRGEIALRIHRACREMGIRTVAVHSTADAEAMHVRLADESVCIGPPNPKNSYLNIPALISAAEMTDADAIHPGYYGFCQRTRAFADIVEAHNIAFIGPTPDHIRLMGDKIAAKQSMRELGVPVVPGVEGGMDDMEHARKSAGEIGYPVLIKASAGGGGRGMQVIQNAEELEEKLTQARNEAMHAFGDDTMYMEKYLPSPRHIEVQVFCDGKGNAIHLGERDCSLQRRHQKVLEEAPSPALNSAEQSSIGERAARAVAD